MGVLSRFTTYITSLMSGALDRAEDPGMTLNYSYQQQLASEAVRSPWAH